MALRVIHKSNPAAHAHAEQEKRALPSICVSVGRTRTLQFYRTQPSRRITARYGTYRTLRTSALLSCSAIWTASRYEYQSSLGST
jgi:hypothetical protein